VSRIVVVVALALSVASCGTMQHAQKLWPFGKKAAPAPAAVNEVAFESAPGQALEVAQYWKRNTLVFDLQAMSGQGAVVARPREGTTWPVRVAIRSRPGSVGEFDVRGSQRVIWPVPQEGTAAVDFELPAAVVRTDTKELAIAWGPRRDPDAPSAVATPVEAPAAVAVEPSPGADAPAATLEPGVAFDPAAAPESAAPPAPAPETPAPPQDAAAQPPSAPGA
jgi:hypothetical protein